MPDTPTDRAPGPASADGPVPPVRPPQTPDRSRPGAVDADIAATPEAAGTGPERELDRLRELATGTVSEIRAQLDDLSPEELRSLRTIEESNRNRTTLLTAIDRALGTGG